MPRTQHQPMRHIEKLYPPPLKSKTLYRQPTIIDEQVEEEDENPAKPDDSDLEDLQSFTSDSLTSDSSLESQRFKMDAESIKKSI